MMNKFILFVINGRLPSLNEYTSANRSNKYMGAKLKRDSEFAVKSSIRRAKLPKVDKYPIALKITWYEPNKRRDIDNIVFATKFIQDALVAEGIIKDDSQKYINKVIHSVYVDKYNPRIEIELIQPTEKEF